MALVACRAPSPVAGSIVGHQFIGLLQRRDPLQRHRTASPDSGPWRRRLIERYDGGLAAVGTGGEHHPVRFDPHQLRRLQVEHDDDRAADEGFGLVRFGDSCNERALRLLMAHFGQRWTFIYSCTMYTTYELVGAIISTFLLLHVTPP